MARKAQMKLQEIETVSERMRNAKKDIEILKADLEELIKTGPAPVKSKEHVEILKPTATNNQIPGPIRSKGPEPSTGASARKPRNYNIEEAREYIKKQRDKRAEVHKKQTTTNERDITRQKLKDLQEKTRELVTRNVQLKRDRSRSKEPADVIRIDKSRSLSKERGAQMGPASHRSNGDKIRDLDPNAPRSLSTARSRKEKSTAKPINEESAREGPQSAEKAASKDIVEVKAPETVTKETQTRLWLEPPPISPEPFNLINIIKQKLNSGPGNENKYTPPAEVRTVQEVKELITKASLKSAKSLNLDFVADYELVPKFVQQIAEDSESDTSKNIPDISTETQTSGSRSLDFSKIKSLRLEKDKTESARFKIISGHLQASDNTGMKLMIENPNRLNLKLLQAENVSGVSTTKTSNNLNLSPLFTDEKLASLSLRSQITELNPRYLHVGKKPLQVQNGEVVFDKTQRPPYSEQIKSTNSAIDSYTSFEPSNSNKTGAKRSVLTPIISKPVSENGSAILEQFSGESGIQSNEINTETEISQSRELSEWHKDVIEEINRSPEVKTINHREAKITLRPRTSENPNEVHLKFEAEVRLLNDFNESFKHFAAVEKAFEVLNQKATDHVKSKLLQNIETQTSLIAKNSSERSHDTIKSINFSRGSEIGEESVQNTSMEWNLSNDSNSTVTSNLTQERSRWSLSTLENWSTKDGSNALFLNVFDQMIKHEDSRIEHLKEIIKIRKQALLDRTKGELMCLEIQRKQFIETGRIEKASLIKKKQRGAILKHEQERNEIKKLRELQKEESLKRRDCLKRQRNLIKSKLSTEIMLCDIEVKTSKKRRFSGPLTASIHSETSSSIQSSVQEAEGGFHDGNAGKASVFPMSNAKRTLVLRESALEKRRKEAEELLKWHRKLLDEEKKIEALEKEASSIIARSSTKHQFTGKQLNLIWANLTDRKEDKYVDEKIYAMSQLALERFCNSARQYSNGKKSTPSDLLNDVSDRSSSDRKTLSEASYSTVFELQSPLEEEAEISSISELIQNFSKIEDEISTINKKSEPDIIQFKDNEDEIRTAEITTSAQSTNEEGNSNLNQVAASILKEITNEEIKSNFSEVTDSAKIQTEGTSEETNSNLSQVTEEISAKIQTESRSEETKSSISQVTEEISTGIQNKSTNEEVESSLSPVIEEISARIQTETRSEETKSQVTEENSIGLQKESTNEELESNLSPVIEEISAGIQKQSTNEEVESNLTQLTEEISARIQKESTNDEPDSNLNQVTEEISARVQNESRNEELESNLTQLTEEISARIQNTSSTSVTSNLSGRVEIDVEMTPNYVFDDHKTETASIGEEDLKTEENVSVLKADSDSDVITVISSDSKKSADSSVVESNEESFKTEDGEKDEDSVSHSSFSLEEALESASKIEETLMKINDQFQKESGDQKVDVKKRVLEILADASPRTDKGSKIQDLYVTTYDVAPELEEQKMSPKVLENEAEELWRKQLAIEQEIKEIEQQQQKQLPYAYMREIPNKPPPPYTPPSPQSSPTILPGDVREINEIAAYSSKVLFKAQQTNNLEKVKYSENAFKLFSNVEVATICVEYLFNVCKDITREFYKQFENVERPVWMTVPKQHLRHKPGSALDLERLFNRKLKEMFGFVKVHHVESALIKWGRKKRDHVDEVLVAEAQEEEPQWVHFEQDELAVKDKLTNDIMNMLLDDTAAVFAKIFPAGQKAE